MRGRMLLTIQTCDMAGPPLLIPPVLDVPLLFASRAVKASDATHEAKPNHKKAVTAWASWHLLDWLCDPLIVPFVEI